MNQQVSLQGTVSDSLGSTFKFFTWTPLLYGQSDFNTLSILNIELIVLIFVFRNEYSIRISVPRNAAGTLV